jgi:hypothetical protein
MSSCHATSFLPRVVELVLARMKLWSGLGNTKTCLGLFTDLSDNEFVLITCAGRSCATIRSAVQNVIVS